MFKPQTGPRAAERAVARIPLRSILLNPHQPRQRFPPDSITQLAESIRKHGLLSPLLVRALGGGQFQLIAGERRLRALETLGRAWAEAIVLPAGDDECALIALVENLQREDLHFLDVAAACRRILDQQSITQESLATALSCSPSALANRLRLLRLPPRVQAEIRRSGLTERHARALLKLEDESAQLSMVAQAAQRQLNVRQLEDRVAQQAGAPTRRSRQVSRVVRDNRIIINALLDTVRELSRIGVPVTSRVEECPDHIDVIVTIPAVASGR